MKSETLNDIKDFMLEIENSDECIFFHLSIKDNNDEKMGIMLDMAKDQFFVYDEYTLLMFNDKEGKETEGMYIPNESIEFITYQKNSSNGKD